MIYIGKSPYRVSLLGGGSDLNWFVKKKQYGLCFGYSLNKFSYTIPIFFLERSPNLFII